MQTVKCSRRHCNWHQKQSDRQSNLFLTSLRLFISSVSPGLARAATSPRHGHAAVVEGRRSHWLAFKRALERLTTFTSLECLSHALGKVLEIRILVKAGIHGTGHKVQGS